LVGGGVDARRGAVRLPARTHAASARAGGGRRALAEATAAVVRVGREVGAARLPAVPEPVGAVAEPEGAAHAVAHAGLLGLGTVDGAVAVVVETVALLRAAAVHQPLGVVAVRSAAHAGRIAVLVPVERLG